MMTSQKLINQHLLTSFPQFEPELVKVLTEHATLKEFNAGDLLMNTGQYMRFTMLVVEGLVKLYREGEDGSEFFMYYIHSGGACALSMICSTKQETSEIKATAVDKTTVLAIPTSIMDDLMKNYKTWYYFVLETYRARFEELLVVIDHISFKAMDERRLFYTETL